MIPGTAGRSVTARSSGRRTGAAGSPDVVDANCTCGLRPACHVRAGPVAGTPEDADSVPDRRPGCGLPGVTGWSQSPIVVFYARGPIVALRHSAAACRPAAAAARK